ncbi:MAG: CDP-2,3-bis-(O-geranylgeranyl)-sn-glycerol synthase [Nanoarchaeota archaeon]|nr:CDP-2,3-bis-(O-geranylgeranyl)-sn-glycerol synthase [Nanoarchaeota archaeon]
MDILLLIGSAIYFMLPAYFANMAPVIVKNGFSFLAVPIDGGRLIRGKPVLGAHKTWRGFIFAVVFGIVTAFIQHLLSDIPWFSSLSIVSYDSWLVWGMLLGSGAIIGDLIESFFKRRSNVSSGKPWIPLDQLDFVIGGLLFAWVAVDLTLSLIFSVLVVSFVLDIMVNHLAYFLKIRGEKW